MRATTSFCSITCMSAMRLSNAARRNSSGELMLYGRLPTMRRPLAERGEVEVERVGDDERQRIGRELRAQARREVAVDLDRRDAPGVRDEARGDRGQPGADLDDGVARARRDGGDDARDVMRIDEEVLAEATARDVAIHRGGAVQPAAARRAASAIARSSAA